MLRSPMKRRTRNTGPTDLVMQVVCRRDDMRCRRCNVLLRGARGTDWDLHHRRPRAMGGSKREDTNSPANIVSLCRACHVAVESYRATGLAEGYLIPQSCEDPSTVALLVDRGSRWVHLSHDGEVTE